MIKARCPNAACGKTLGMKPEFAGKKAKCPHCGIMFTIPGQPGTAPPSRQEELPELEAIATVIVAEGQYPQDYPQQYPAPYQQPPAPPVAQLAPEPAPQFAPPKPRKRLRSKSKLDASTGIMLGVAIFLLVFLALTPLLTWAWQSVTFNIGNQTRSGSASLSGLGKISNSQGQVGSVGSSWPRTHGWLILSISLTAAVIVGLIVAVGAILGLAEDWSYEVLTGGTVFGGAWGTISTVWTLANIWKVISGWIKASSDLRKAKELLPGGFRAVESVTVLPGLGLWLGLLASIALIAVFTAMAGRRQRIVPMLIAHAIAAGIGLLILLFFVQPWSALTDAGSF